MKDKAMNMLSTGLGLSADVNLSKIPFPNRIIGKTLCSSLERTDLATKLSSKPMQQNLSSWFSLPVQTGLALASFDGTFSETLGDQKAGVQSMVDKLKLSAELPQMNQF